jgi:hypothetical protein
VWKKIWSKGGKENTVFPLPDTQCLERTERKDREGQAIVIKDFFFG